MVLCWDTRIGCRVLQQGPGGGRILFHDLKLIKAHLV